MLTPKFNDAYPVCPDSLPVFVVVVVALLFYVHSKHVRSCQDGQLT